MKTLIPPRPPLLEADALGALTKIQIAVKQMVRALPGTFERPSHLQHCLDIDAKVAWHVFKLVNAKDPLAAAPHVPGLLLMRRIGQAAMRKGVPAEVVEFAQLAIAEFDVIVKQHAATRTAFKAIVATVAGDQPAETMGLQQRHTAFNMESQLWGKQVDLHLSQAIFVRKNEHETTTGVVSVKGGLQMLRSDASALVDGFFSPDSTPIKSRPLEPEAANIYGCSLLPSFCSQPIPQFMTEQRSDGWQKSRVQNESIGRSGAVDLTFGRCLDTDPFCVRRNGDPMVIHGTQFLTPTALGVLEFLVHRPSFPNASPEYAIFGELTLTTMEDLVDYGQRMPQYGTMHRLGNAASAQTPPHECLPRYNELQDHVFAKLGWNRSEFDLYRVVLSYPVLHTTGAIWFKV